MKPIRIPEDFIAARWTAFGTVASRMSRIRGVAMDDGDTAAKTNEDPEAKSSGEVRIIPVRGILMRDCRGWFPFATDTEELEEMLDEADNDNNVAAIVLDFDSPGGAVNGSFEVADFVASISKPVVSYVAGDCCSAAYAIAAGSDEILIRRTATVASVGVYSAILDISGYYEQMGVKAEVFASGDQKAAGYPGTTLSDAQRTVIQAEIARLGDIFRTHVVDHRNEVDIDMLDGRAISGEPAVELGFADGIVGSISDAVKAALALAAE